MLDANCEADVEAQAIFLGMYAPYYGLCNSSGSLAMFTAIRRASSLLNNLARAFGTKRTSRHAQPMSAFAGKADIPQCPVLSAFEGKATSADMTQVPAMRRVCAFCRDLFVER
jgi:hypothetical protein